MARIHRRSAGTWEVSLELGRDPRTGKRERRTFTVRGSKREAEQAAAAQVAAIAGGAFVDPSKETVEQFLRGWLRDYVEPSLALRTQQRYREILEYDLVPRSAGSRSRSSGRTTSSPSSSTSASQATGVRAGVWVPPASRRSTTFSIARWRTPSDGRPSR